MWETPLEKEGRRRWRTLRCWIVFWRGKGGECVKVYRRKKPQWNVKISGKKEGRKKKDPSVYCTFVYILQFEWRRREKLVKTSTGVIIRQRSELYYTHTAERGKCPPTKKNKTFSFFVFQHRVWNKRCTLRQIYSRNRCCCQSIYSLYTLLYSAPFGCSFTRELRIPDRIDRRNAYI